jgi:hypothetical protein
MYLTVKLHDEKERTTDYSSNTRQARSKNASSASAANHTILLNKGNILTAVGGADGLGCPAHHTNGSSRYV